MPGSLASSSIKRATGCAVIAGVVADKRLASLPRPVEVAVATLATLPQFYHNLRGDRPIDRVRSRDLAAALCETIKFVPWERYLKQTQPMAFSGAREKRGNSGLTRYCVSGIAMIL